MGKSQFIYVSYIATTPKQLWEALTQGEFTRKYWYDRRIESDWRTGSPVLFYDGGSDVVTDDGVVIESDPPRRLVYTFHPRMSRPDQEDWGYSRVAFTLEAHPGLVKMTLVHDDLPNQQMADGFREGWAPILSSLKTFLETGKPLLQLRSFEEKGQPKPAVKK